MDSCGFDIEISDVISAVQNDWEELEAEGLLTPFQTRAWLLPFYKILAPRLNAKPFFVTLRDTTTRRPAMLLPLCMRRRCGVDLIEFADLGVSDYNAPLIAKTFNPTPARWREIWRHIMAAFKGGAILRLEKMPRLIGDRLNPLIQPTQGLSAMRVASWGVSLPATMTDYNARILNPSFSKELEKKLRRVTKRGEIEYIVAQTQDEKRRAFDILAQQRQARCDEMARSNILAQSDYRQFYETIAVEGAEALASLSLLKVGGEIVGTIFALNHRGAQHVIMSTFLGGEWKSCSLGNVLMQTSISHAISNGINFFDLTIGNEGYKQHFGATPNPLYAALQPLTPLGSFVAVPMACYAQMKRTARDFVRGNDFEIDKRFSHAT